MPKRPPQPQTNHRERKFGILGGTFDPIHYGHLRAAEETCSRLDLEKVIFIPAFLPPHKLNDPLSTPQHRLEMVRRGTAGNPRLDVSEVEISELEKPSYTVKTLEHLRARTPGEIYYLIGMDSFLEIPTWRDFPRLFQLCHVVAFTRPGFPSRAELKLPTKFERILEPAGENLFLHPAGHQVIILTITGFDVSSTRIRGLVRAGESIRYLLPPAVEEYIRKEKLYLP